MARVFIGVGHGGADPGAVSGGFREADINLVVALACKRELERHGVEVAVSRERDENDKLAEEIAECKAFAPDVAVEIHNNAGGGDGFEVYVQSNSHGEKSRKLAAEIEKKVVELGQNSRGIKTRLNGNGEDYFGWLRQLDCPAVLTEGFFVDHPKDRADFDSEGKQQALGVAYAQAVLEYLGISLLEEKEPVLYHIRGKIGEMDVDLQISKLIVE